MLIALDNSARSMGPRCVRLICWSGLQVYTFFFFFDSSILVNDAPYTILMSLTGDSASTQPLIETDARAILSRAQPRVQIVYVHPSNLAALLMQVTFEFCAFG